MHAPRSLHPVASTGAAPAASLTLGARGDRFEREADRAADQVLSGQGRPQLTRLNETPIQREDDRKKEPPSPAGEGLAIVGENLGENNPAFSAFTEQLADRFLAQPAPISVGIPTFLGANYAFLWGMAMVNPAMRRSFDDFNLALLPGLVPQFPVKTFQYRILDSAQTRFSFEVGLDASELMTAFNEGVLNTRVSSVKFDTEGTLDTNGPKPVSLSALQVKMGLFGEGVLLTGGFRNGISPYPLTGEDGSRVMAQTPALPDLYADQRDVRFTLSLDLVKLADHFGGTPPAPRKAESLQRKAADGAPVAEAAPSVRSTLDAGGESLDSGTRSFMESRFGHDFSKVRIHADASAATSARALHAHAYTVGGHIAFAPGRYAPHTAPGRRLLAHELAHVVQQGAFPGAIQRQLDVDDFDTDDFDAKTLQTYLAKVTPGTIEDNRNSDDKARALVRMWRQGRQSLTADQKIVLIREMQSGFTGNDDERAILALLLGSPEPEIAQLFAPKTGLEPKDLDSDFHGAEEDALRAFYEQHFIGGKKAALDGSQRVKSAAPAKADEPAVKAPAGEEAAGPPRQDYVFIMGDIKKDGFYREANRFFRAHRPQAIFVTDKRNLADVLSHIASEISDPIGNLYLVSHANEDGTLSFGLDGDDKDKKLDVTELRKALRPASGVSALSRVRKQVDAHTVVRIKGCDIGRTKEMLDLLDEAFGGAGTVTAPTHEQVYGTDPELAKAADKAFRDKVAAGHPEPAAVDKTLKGKDLIAAKSARAKALKQREKDIAAELKSRDAERKAVVAKANSYEAFSGPMFQRPGDQLYTADELQPMLAALYPHLSEKQRASLAKRLAAPDPRGDSVNFSDSTYKQKGQRIFRRVIPQSHWDPQDASGFLALYRSVGGKVRKGFVPGSVTSSDGTSKDGKPVRDFALSGSLPKGGTETHTLQAPPVPSDAEFEATARGTVNNPDRYLWKFERSYSAKTGKTTLKATATRVVVYLHHASLDAEPHKHFNRPEPDSDFYARSTFEPPPATPKP